MNKQLLLSLFTLLLICGYKPAYAEHALTGPDIEELLSGNTAIAVDVTGTRWRQIFLEDGSSRYYSGSRPPSTGFWRVEGAQYCSQWPPNTDWACYDVVMDVRGTPKTPVVKWVSAEGSEDISAVFSGDRTFGALPHELKDFK